MAGLVPAIHVLISAKGKTRMPGTRPGMTTGETTSSPYPFSPCLAETVAGLPLVLTTRT
jgi:hypothetical protein